jgi:hypothetical protein
MIAKGSANKRQQPETWEGEAEANPGKKSEVASRLSTNRSLGQFRAEEKSRPSRRHGRDRREDHEIGSLERGVLIETAGRRSTPGRAVERQLSPALLRAVG